MTACGKPESKKLTVKPCLEKDKGGVVVHSVISAFKRWWQKDQEFKVLILVTYKFKVGLCSQLLLESEESELAMLQAGQPAAAAFTSPFLVESFPKGGLQE